MICNLILMVRTGECFFVIHLGLLASLKLGKKGRNTRNRIAIINHVLQIFISEKKSKLLFTEHLHAVLKAVIFSI